MKQTLDFETQLHMIPVRNAKLAVRPSERTPAAIVVEVQLRYPGVLGLFARWSNARQRKRYELAGLSREMFEMVDGSVTVAQLIDWLCIQDRLTFLEGRALVVHYLRDLMKRGLIVISGAPITTR